MEGKHVAVVVGYTAVLALAWRWLSGFLDVSFYGNGLRNGLVFLLWLLPILGYAMVVAMQRADKDQD